MKIKNIKDLIIQFDDETIFNKRLSALRKYNTGAVKDLFFKELEQIHIKDNNYHLNLFTDKKFKLIHGQVYINCTIERNIVTIIDIEPKKFLDKAFMCLLDTYKGIPITSEKDLVKIKILERMGKLE